VHDQLRGLYKNVISKMKKFKMWHKFNDIKHTFTQDENYVEVKGRPPHDHHIQLPIESEVILRIWNHENLNFKTKTSLNGTITELLERFNAKPSWHSELTLAIIDFMAWSYAWSYDHLKNLDGNGKSTTHFFIALCEGPNNIWLGSFL
jgi:hypothetical protein